MSTIDLRATLSRPPDWSDDGGGLAAFWMLGETDSGALWIGRWTGASPWERHPNGDELLHQLEGEVKITLLLDEGEKVVHLRAGEIFVVPKNTWHKQESVSETVQWGKTPMPTDHSDADDPRNDE